MKKIASILLISVMCVLALSAQEKTAGEAMAEEYRAASAAYTSIGSTFTPENARMLGMGGAGLAFEDAENGLFYNPATLGAGELRISLPSVSVSVYHVYDILKEDLINKISGDKSQLVSSILNVVGTQYAPLVKADVSTSVILPFGLGFGVYAGDTLSTYSGSAIDQVDVALVAGYGHRFYLGNVSVSAGVTAEYDALVFNKRVKIADVMKADDVMSTSLTLASGWSGKLPVFDAGLTIDISGLSASVVVSNVLESSFDMTVRESKIKDLGFEQVKDDIFSETADFKVSGKRTISAGLAGDFSGNLLGLRFALDVLDIQGLADSVGSAQDAKRVILKYVNAGLEVSLADFIAARVGLNSGYWTVGATLRLAGVFRVDAAYYWKEMGASAGSRGLDGLSVRFNLGWE